MHAATFNRLESLSNEVLLDIFEYLDGYDLCQAFYGLNYRINTLLQSARLHILYDASKEDEIIWNILTTFIKFSQIRILSSYGHHNINEQFLSTTNGKICTVRLHEMNEEEIDKILQHFPDDNRIQCLSLKPTLVYYQAKTQSIMDFLFVNQGHRFTSLVHLSIFGNYWTTFPQVSVIFPKLRHLSIENCYFSSNLHEFLQKNTPNLRSLKFNGTFNQVTPSSIIVKQVQELQITNPSNLLMMQAVLSNFPSLRRLHIDWNYNRRISVMTGTQWQQLIQLYLPELKQLTIEFNQGIDQNILQTFYTSEYWSTKKLKAKMFINKTYSRYKLLQKIYIGKEWHFSYFDHL